MYWNAVQKLSSFFRCEWEVANVDFKEMLPAPIQNCQNGSLKYSGLKGLHYELEIPA